MKKAATPLFSLQTLRDEHRSFQYKGRGRIVLMSIDRFLKLAAPISEPTPEKIDRIERALVEKVRLADIPFLQLRWRYPDNKTDAVLLVTGHEGRHRALVLKKHGYTHMPVVLLVPFRWSEQDDPEKFDYSNKWPTAIVPENRPRATKTPFPIPRQRATGGPTVWVNPHPNEPTLSVQQGLFFLAMERQIAAEGLQFEYDVRPSTQWKAAYNEMWIRQKETAIAKLELIPSDQKKVDLGYIGVATYVRRQGVAKLLMQMMANAADEACVDMWLTISPDYKRGRGRAKDMLTERQLQKFYAKYGFVSTKCNWKTMGRVKL